MDSDERLLVVNRVGKTTIIANVVLSVFKILSGIIARSGAMVADGIHTLSDVVTTIAVMIGMKLSTKPDDSDHPYGHEKIEAVVSKLLAILLAITAIGIGYSGIKNIIHSDFTRPGMLALVAAVISIAVKEWMYHYTVRAAKKIDSPSLKADAWHHRSDAFSSVGTLIGIGGAIAGIEILDPIASIAVCVMIIRVSVEIYIQAYNQLIDKAASQEDINKIKEIISGVKGVYCIDDIKTRIHGPRIFVDVEISVDGNLTVYEGHQIAQEVHDKIESNMPDVKHCMVHVNPYFKLN